MAISTERVSIPLSGGGSMGGYLALPEGDGPHPVRDDGVGLRSRRLARLRVRPRRGGPRREERSQEEHHPAGASPKPSGFRHRREITADGDPPPAQRVVANSWYACRVV